MYPPPFVAAPTAVTHGAAFAPPSKYASGCYLGLCRLTRLLPTQPNMEVGGTRIGKAPRLARPPHHVTRRATAARHVLHRISRFSCARPCGAALWLVFVQGIGLLFANYRTGVRFLATIRENPRPSVGANKNRTKKSWQFSMHAECLLKTKRSKKSIDQLVSMH